MTHWIVLYAIGAAQAMLLSLTLWRRPVNVAANRVLVLWLALVGVDLAMRALYLVEPSPELLRAYRLVGLLPFLYGPLFYLYARALAQGIGLRVGDAVHAIGLLLGMLAYADLLLLDRVGVEALFERLARGDYPARAPYVDGAMFVYSLSYLAAACRVLFRYRRQLLASRADADPDALRWLLLMAASQLLIWAIALAQWLIPVPWLSGRLIYAAVALWVLLVAFRSLLQTPVLAPEADLDARPAQPGSDQDRREDPRYAEVAARLRVLMEEQHLYREPALSIGQLARRSGYPEYLVSEVINRRLGGPFWDYVNRYRVNAARACLLDPGDRRTALDIAYDCGFVSKSTFNTAFKRLSGETPSDCRRRASASA